MKYFLMQTNEEYADAPNIINWYKKIDINNIRKGKSHLLPKREVLEIKSNKNTTFVDVVSFPFLLVSDVCKEVINKYEPKTPFKQMVLLDGENSKAELYHMPILEKVDCLAEGSKLNLDRSVIQKAVLDYSKIKDLSIFQIDNVKKVYTVVRLDILESFLRRGAKGISISEIELYKGESRYNE